jgi:predicted nucleic acid-binding protein
LKTDPEKTRIVELTKDCEIISPEVLPFEIGNALSAMNKQKKLSENEILECFTIFNQIPVRFVETALQIAIRNNIYAYDAYYLEIAKRLKIPLLTLDNKMIEVAKKMKISTFEVI